MKIIDPQHIIYDQRFWVYFLSVAFPFAYDEEDQHLQDLISENFDVSAGSSNVKWCNNFVQYYDNVIDENDGYVDNPTSVEIKAGEDRYIIQFHPGDILFFLNGKQIGCTGPHYKLHQLSLQTLIRTVETAEEPNSTALLLPMLYIRDPETLTARKLIEKMLKSAPFEQELLDTVVSLITEGAKL